MNKKRTYVYFRLYDLIAKGWLTTLMVFSMSKDFLLKCPDSMTDGGMLFFLSFLLFLVCVFGMVAPKGLFVKGQETALRPSNVECNC